MPPSSKEPMINFKNCFHPLVTSLQPHCLLSRGTEWQSFEGELRYESAYTMLLWQLSVIVLGGGRAGIMGYTMVVVHGKLHFFECVMTTDVNETYINIAGKHIPGCNSSRSADDICVPHIW